MAGAEIKITIDDKEVRDLLSQIQARAGDATPAMKIIGEILRKSVWENFRQGGRPTKWKPLAAATLLGGIGGKGAWTKKGKIRKGAERKLQNKQILIGKGMAGGLMGSITYAAFLDRVVVGSNKKYAAIHQFGGPAGRASHRVDIPARPYLLVQDGDWAAIKEQLIRYLTRR